MRSSDPPGESTVRSLFLKWDGPRNDTVGLGKYVRAGAAMAQYGPPAGVPAGTPQEGDPGFGITPGLTFENASTVGDMRLLIRQTKEYAERLEKRMQDTEIETVQKFANLQFELAQAQMKGNAEKHEHFELIDAKLMAPSKFDGTKIDEYRNWAKRTRAYCNAKRIGFRKVMETCEKSPVEIDQAVMSAWGWAPASSANLFEADKKLFDLLVLICSGEALNLVGRLPDRGFEGWRQLALRFHPVGETYAFDNELPHASGSRSKYGRTASGDRHVGVEHRQVRGSERPEVP